MSLCHAIYADESPPKMDWPHERALEMLSPTFLAPSVGSGVCSQKQARVGMRSVLDPNSNCTAAKQPTSQLEGSVDEAAILVHVVAEKVGAVHLEEETK